MLELLRHVLALLLSFVGPVDLIPKVQQALGLPVPQGTVTVLSATNLAYLQSGSYGLASLAARLDALTSSGVNNLQDILDALAPVTLPPVPPDGWGADIAARVWNYYLLNATPATVTADQMLSWAGQFAAEVGTQGVFRMVMAPDFAIEHPWADQWDLWHNYGWEPQPDYTDVQPGETVLHWLNRTDLVYPDLWQTQVNGELAFVFPPGPGPRPAKIWCLLHNAQLPNRLEAAPIWPGLANVTLGTPVALSTDLTVAGPLDGVLVAVTTPPTGLGKFEIGGRTWWYRAGQVSFVSDDGQVEPWQYLSWDQALYCPKVMTRAASALVRGLAGIGGTVTPWLTTPP